ncbi:Pyridoxal phosphate-dependent aminotransferase [Planctomycetales bacterium 10988]|nr:Pyridoxal phosphate-dependent aminotransferase [Planctomycetales bacterium 10988]
MSTASSIELSQRVQSIQPSATIAMATKAKELKATGAKVYDFSLGEPDFTTPDHICAAATQAMKEGKTHYTPAAGTVELRAAISEDYQKTHGISYAPSQVVVSNGAKHSLHNVLATLCNPGDEVIIPAPYWVSYAALVELTGATPVILETKQEENFLLKPETLEAAINERTKVLMLCSPSNPTGSMYDEAALKGLAEVVLKHSLLVITDEIYEKLVYEGRKFVSFPTVDPQLVDRTIVVNGVSKAYAMTGWRIGWALAPEAIAKGMSKLQSQQTSGPSSIAQAASVAALTSSQDCVEEMLEQFAKRRSYVQGRIANIPRLTNTDMDGAFYAFINISSYFGKSFGGTQVDDSETFCLQLLEQQQVATVMGSAFGAEGYVRISYATSMDILEAGFDRLEAFLKSAQ